jgi:hypothetical protein
MKPDIIPGYPDNVDAHVKLFQGNNHRVADGVIGPKTRSAIWRPEGDDMYTHLAWHEYKRGAAVIDRKFCKQYLLSIGERLDLRPEHMTTIFHFLSSEWSTGFRYCSTQDGVTWGFRRFAARTLRNFVRLNADGFRRYLGSFGLLEVKEKLKRAPNNGWPLNDPAIRHGFIEAAIDGKLWARQIEHALGDVHKVLRGHRWTHGRTIALACRAENSSPKFLEGLPRREKDAYRELKRRYAAAGKERRVMRIESQVSDTDVWR